MQTLKTLFLAWEDPSSHSWFPIGRLTFDGMQYQFVYTKGVLDAQATKFGFQPLHSFPDLGREYSSPELFPLFSNRLMRPSRPDYEDYIEWLNIPRHQDDPIALLSRSGGRKATDTFEIFPAPILDETGEYHIHFFAHRLRDLPECSVDRIHHLNSGDRLYLAHDCQNPYDPCALMLCTRDHHVVVGYCPRYLASDTLSVLQKHPESVKVSVERINLAPTPLQFGLLCNLTAQWPFEAPPCSGKAYQALQTQTKIPVIIQR